MKATPSHSGLTQSQLTTHNSQNVQILKGARDLDTGLWRINLRKEYQQHPREVANNV
jgi:hypothetical protein